MRQKWLFAVGTAAILALSGCSGNNDDQGGGGGNPRETHDDSNPVTREEATGNMLKTVPDEATQGTTGNRPVTDQDRVSNTRVKPIARGGQALMKVDVNSATVQELTQVPGINVNLAQQIVANRPYRDAKDLSAKIPTLQPNVVASFQQYLAFGGGGAGAGDHSGHQMKK